MKRVVFGYEGGFPLEQETLMQIQAAYEEDMLDALFALWGLDVTQRYLVKLPKNANEEGWIISPQEILLRGVGQDDKNSEVNESDDVKVTKLQIIRLSYFTGGNRVVIEDKRLADGNLPYSEGTENKVYEEFVAKLVNSPLKDSIDLKSFIPLTTVLDLENKVDNNVAEISSIKEDYLPRNGSKPMTGNLNLGVDKPNLTPGEEGTRLYFKGTGSNTDSIFMSKHTPSSDVTELRVNVGDNAQTGSKDAFVVGGSISGQPGWHEKFRVQTDGKVGIGVNNPSKNLDVDAGNNSLKFQNLAEVNSQTPLVIDNQGNVGKNTNGITSANFIPGMIMMWSGDANNVPTGWVLCDGRASINGVKIPDLRGRFVLGVGDRYLLTDTGGVISENDDRDIEINMHDMRGADKVRLQLGEMPAHKHSRDDQYKYFVARANSFPTGDSSVGGADRESFNDEIAVNLVNFSQAEEQIEGRNQSHSNMPPYYALAYIVYVGDYTPVVNPIASVKFDDEGNSTVRKIVTVDDGDNVIARIDGSDSQDPDGSIAQYIWERCFDNGTIQDPWTIISAQPILTLLTFTIPTSGKRYGTHYFRLKVIDNDGNVSGYSRQLEFVVNRRVIINPNPSQITLSEDRVIFEGYELAGVQTIRITGNPGWRVKTKDSFITVSPNSSSNNLVTTVNLFISPNPRINNQGTVVFETTDGADTAILNWSALIPIDNPIDIGIGGGGSCFDLESDILMASGQSKKLKNIVVGDELRTFNFVNPLSSTNEESSLLTDLMKGATKETSKVVDFGIQTVAEYRKITLVNGKILNVTASHPILASKDNNEVSWLLPDDLRGGYFIVDDNGKLIEIESKRTVKSSLEIGVLQLENGDNYFVNDVMVHNANIIRAVAREVNNVQPLEVQPIDVIEK